MPSQTKDITVVIQHKSAIFDESGILRENICKLKIFKNSCLQAHFSKVFEHQFKDTTTRAHCNNFFFQMPSKNVSS